MSEFNIDIIDNNLYFTGDIQPDSYHRFTTVLYGLENRYSSSVNKSVNLHLFSDGGRVDSGLAIHD